MHYSTAAFSDHLSTCSEPVILQGGSEDLVFGSTCFR